MTKGDFLNSPPVLPVTVAGQPILGKVKMFKSSRNVGWNLTKKVDLTLPDGSVVRAQLNCNITILGSKDWQDGEIPVRFLETDEAA